jgi:anti-sigma factor RsiW
MNCEEFEMLMVDALGDELPSRRHPAFSAHLAECSKCRRDYESARRAVETMRDLPAPRPVTVRREGDRLVIENPRAAGFNPRGRPRRLTPATRLGRGLLRYAASVLIAFTAGYALHAGLMVRGAVRPGGIPVRQGTETGLPEPDGGLQQALVDAHDRSPSSSNLAKCLMAMARGRR